MFKQGALIIDDFTEAYIAAALWSTHDERNYDEHGSVIRKPDGSWLYPEMLDGSFDFFDFTPEALQQIVADCEKFQAENAADIMAAADVEGSDYSHSQYSVEERAGHDFWLTRNHHGAGFWDRGLGAVGNKLTAAAHAYRECDIYIGDDGRLYV